MIDEKEQYLRTEFWILSVGAAFQRANVYQHATDRQKSQFRKELFEYLNELSDQYRNGSIIEDDHIDYIDKVRNKAKSIADQHGIELTDNKFRFGIAQKLLNLYLKYLWCAGFIQEPPHFPVDRIIIQSLKIVPFTNWTELDSKKEYLHIISAAKQEANGQNLAQWELETYKRR
ncbi:MAG: hypothetical protein DSY77_05970 [Bacteroidetes bacterium]|nr:MAG: hypothetical protein DSY77_05970 [Bacteroidota bacterium]